MRTVSYDADPDGAATRAPAPSRPKRTGWLLALAWSATFLTFGTTPSAAQEASQVGAAIQATCGAIDPETQAVVAGTVADSVSGVPLRDADVHLSWRIGGIPQNADAVTDGQGFFAFCRVPAGAEVTVVAERLETSEPVTVTAEPGMLHVEHLLVPLSDPAEPGVLVGRVVDAESRAPIADAQVEIRERSVHATTNGQGYFTFGDQPWGVYTLAVSTLGYATVEAPVRVAGDLTQMVEIALSPDALELEGLTVTVQPRSRRRDIDGLVHRMNLGFGTFITRDVLERRMMTPVPDLLREVPGILVHHNRLSTTFEVRGRACTPNFFLDGVRYLWEPTAGINIVRAEDLEVIEVYKGIEIPGKYLLPGQMRACAAVVMWTRGVGR